MYYRLLRGSAQCGTPITASKAMICKELLQHQIEKKRIATITRSVIAHLVRVRVKGCDRLQGIQAVGMTTQVFLPPYGGAPLTESVTH